MAELERLKVALISKDKQAQAELEQQPFLAVKTPGTVPLSSGNLPELHWDALQPPQAPPAGTFPGELDFFGMPLGSPPAASAPAPPASELPTLPTLPASIKLRPASQATLSRHAILPSQSLGSAPPRQQSAGAGAAIAQKRPLYPQFAPIEPLPPASSSSSAPPLPDSIEAQLASLDVGSSAAVAEQEQQQPTWPTPSPYGELQLGPQEVAVQSMQPPTAPLLPGETCCTPPPEPGNLALSEPAAGRPGVAEVKRRQSVRDVHVSVALMDEFMRWVGQGGGLGTAATSPCPPRLWTVLTPTATATATAEDIENSRRENLWAPILHNLMGGFRGEW